MTTIDSKSSHYDAGGIETMAVIRAKLTPEQFEGFLLGNIIKYSTRCNHKGQYERDIEKASIYATVLQNEQALKRTATSDLTGQKVGDTVVVQGTIARKDTTATPSDPKPPKPTTTGSITIGNFGKDPA